MIFQLNFLAVVCESMLFLFLFRLNLNKVGVIVIADGHYLSAQGLKSLIINETKDTLLSCCLTVNDLMHDVNNQFIDLIILDPKSILGFNISDISLLASEASHSKILIVSENLTKREIFSIIDHKIDGFLTKSCSKAEIINAIESVQKGNKFYCNTVLELILNKKTSKNPIENCDPSVLTERETEIVKMIGRGETTTRISEILNLSKHTVNTHRKNILRKLDLKTPAQVVTYALQNY